MIDDNKENVSTVASEYATKQELNDEAEIRAENDNELSSELDNQKTQINTLRRKIIGAELDAADASLNLTAAPAYATKQELNAESRKWTQSNENIMNEFDALQKTQNSKINNLNQKVDAAKKSVDEMADSVAKLDGVGERIVDIENTFRDQINRLETEKSKLLTDIEQKNKTIIQKDGVIKDLMKEIEMNNDKNFIHLTFAEKPEFTITLVMSVKDFINNHLKEVVLPRMEVRYPEAEFGKDYTLAIVGLQYIDVMQGKYMEVLISAINGGILAGEDTFDIEINHQYELDQQLEFLTQFLKPSIPTSLWDVPESAYPDYKLEKEIVDTQPLGILLAHQNLTHLTFKVFAELNAGSYAHDFHQDWQYIMSGYGGRNPSTIGGTIKIVNIPTLYKNTTGYYNAVFELIEQRINDSGVECLLTKKWVHNTRGDWLLHTLGNLTFNINKANLADDEIVTVPSRRYYLMLNFSIVLAANQQTNFYRGVTLALTDTLEFY